MRRYRADVLVLTEIYAASEEKLPGIEASLLAEAIRDHGHRDDVESTQHGGNHV